MGVFSRFRRKKQSMEEPGEPDSAELTASGSGSSGSGSESEAGGTVTRVAVPGVTAPEESPEESSGTASAEASDEDSEATEAAAEVVEIPRQQSADTAADAGTNTVSGADSETGESART